MGRKRASTSTTRRRRSPKKKRPIANVPVAREEASNSSPPRLLTCLPSANPELHWRLRNDTEFDLPGDDDLPDSVDLREDWWQIGDQGTTGSCVGWAVADSVLRWHFVKDNRLAEDRHLSPRFIWMAAKETDEYTQRPSSFIETDGTSLAAALDVARKMGCVLDDFLPFNSGHLYAGNHDSFYMSAARFIIRMYVTLEGVREWKQWLAKQGPVLVRVEVDQNWDSYTNGRLDVYDPFPSGVPGKGGHAAAIVGYTESGEFIFRNSWGKKWGEGGFARASALYAHTAVSEAFGVYI